MKPWQRVCSGGPPDDRHRVGVPHGLAADATTHMTNEPPHGVGVHQNPADLQGGAPRPEAGRSQIAVRPPSTLRIAPVM
jgi:hypothetical protein